MPQAEVFEFLSDKATHGGCEVRRIDTHAAAVFLAGDRAYKIKREVSFPFLDYSTLDKRRQACLAELDINRAFAPMLYRRVVAITRDSGGRLAIGGDGEPIEWAVEMVRFDENLTLDRIAESRGIDDELAEQLGTIVAKMHAGAPLADAGSWLIAVEKYIEQNTAAFRNYPALFPQDAVTGLAAASRAALDRHRPLLLSRGRSGAVRRGHGDLHLGNIARLEGRPVPFDAIEFDPLVATGDVLYDLAFLLMDLLERRLARAANMVLNRYFFGARQSEQYDGLAALPLFLSLRAAIRAKVTAARLANVGARDRDGLERAAVTYFQLAIALLSPAPAMLIAVGGLSGTGKSLLARNLAPDVQPAPGALVLRSDVERKLLLNVAENERLPEGAYHADVNARVYKILCEKAARIVRAGHSAIVDAVFARADERNAIAAVARASRAAFNGLFLVAELKTRLARVGTRIRDASDADAAVARSQETFDLGPIEWTKIDASESANDTLTRARAALKRSNASC